jgi:hypothetical protein
MQLTIHRRLEQEIKILVRRKNPGIHEEAIGSDLMRKAIERAVVLNLAIFGVTILPGPDDGDAIPMTGDEAKNHQDEISSDRQGF